MKRVISPLLCLLVGVCIGWSLAYYGPTAKNQRALLEQYRYVRDKFHMTDDEMAQAGKQIPQYFEDMNRQDEWAAIYGLATFVFLERGNLEGAKKESLKPVGIYYRLYHNKIQDTNFISKIEQAAQKYPAIKAEISRESP